MPAALTNVDRRSQATPFGYRSKMGMPALGRTPRGAPGGARHGATGRAFWLALALVPLLVGCSRDDSANAQRIAARFVEQVNTNTCDDPSGLQQVSDAEESSGWAAHWTEACHAAAADLGSGATISQPTATSSSGGEIGFNYHAIAQYENSQNLPASLRFEFDGEGTGADRATLEEISSLATLEFGWDRPHVYGQGAIDLRAEQLVSSVESLLVEGQCDQIRTLLAPAANFSGGGQSVDDCAAMARTISTATSGSEVEVVSDLPFASGSWSAGVYSTVDLFGGKNDVEGIPRRPGESQSDYGYRVLAQIETTNILAEKVITDPALPRQLIVSIVLFEGNWYLLHLEFQTQAFVVQFD